jgi:hypothetical protein
MVQPMPTGFIWDTQLKWIEMPEWDGDPDEAIAWTLRGDDLAHLQPGQPYRGALKGGTC